jgi:hypothetical protein
MSLVLSFKSWKLNNGVLINFCATSCIWSWHFISGSVENCVFSWCTCTPTTREFDALIACDVLVSLSQPHFEGSVRLPLTLPKMGLGSTPGLLKI